LLAARQQAAEARKRLLREFSAIPIGGDAFQKFERMCRKVEQAEAEADALAELSGNDRAAVELFTSGRGAGDKDVEAELASLKGQCGA
jgi:phage shock protein A